MKISRSLSVVAVCLLSTAAGASGEDRIAQLSKVGGNVTIRRAAGAIETAKQQGPRVVNGSIFAGDEIGTDSGASATMLFTDGSTVDLKEKTRLTLREVDHSATVSAQQPKRFGRVLKVLAGDVLTHVVPNPEIATEFETPSGVAAVKGTTFEISVR
jgi:hypothetical protein